MKIIRLLMLSAAMIGMFSLTSCGSAPGVDEGELLGRGVEREVKGSIFVSPTAHQRIYQKVAVMPFRAPVELVGSSISDMFATEILKTYKYQLVERSQMEQVLGEQALGLKGVTDSALAMKVGKLLGVQGVIVGTVPEYGSKASGSSELAAIGINIRMIDVSDGNIVWSITDSAISDKPISLSSFARRIIDNIVNRLLYEWIRAGDTHAANLPIPQVVSYNGKIRGAVFEILGDAVQTYQGYNLLRSRTEKGLYEKVATAENQGAGKIIRIEEKGLLDAETYYYKVSAVSKSGLTSIPSGPFKITTTGPPSPVTDLKASGNNPRKVPLSWTPVNEPEIKGYVIYRATMKNGPFEKIKSVDGKNTSQYVDKGKEEEGFWGSGEPLKDYTRYFYKIQAVNVVDVQGPDSPVVSAVTKPIPAAVTGLRAKQLEVKQVSLSWKSNPETDITKYEVFRGDEPLSVNKHIENLPASATHYTDKDLKDGLKYYYTVRAVDKDGLLGKFSEVVSSSTKPVPRKPQGLKANFEGDHIKITWQPNPEQDIARYVVTRKSFLFWDKMGESTGTNFVYRGELKKGKSFTFRIIAVDQTSLESEPSEEVSITIP